MLMDVKNLEIELGLLHERICSALGDATRIMILYALSEKGLYVNELADMLDLPSPPSRGICGCCATAAWWPPTGRALPCGTRCAMAASSSPWT